MWSNLIHSICCIPVNGGYIEDWKAVGWELEPIFYVNVPDIDTSIFLKTYNQVQRFENIWNRNT